MTESVAIKIVEAVASERGISPMALDYALQEHIDVEALERLLAHGAGSWELSFELPDIHVTVNSDADVQIRAKNNSLRKLSPRRTGSFEATEEDQRE